jgi:hypothetical protein
MNSAVFRRDGVSSVVHTSFSSFRDQLEREPLWFSAPAEIPYGDTYRFGDRLTIHFYDEAAALCLREPNPSDLIALKALSSNVLLNKPSVYFEGFPDGDIATALALEGFRTFCSYSDEMSLRDRAIPACAIGKYPFLLSTHQRLSQFPSSSSSRVIATRPDTVRTKTLFVVDLIQDVEILTPLIRRAADPYSPFLLEVAVSTRVMKAHVWDALLAFFVNHSISWFNPQTSLELVSRIGREKTLLITASESSAPGHAFCHQACKIAPSNTVRITMQHGYECVGFRHHKAHDLQFLNGVRFASDIILTWQHPDELPDLHPLERDKCIAVGVIKSFAEDSAHIRESRWQLETDALTQSEREKTTLLIAENLHSVRFSSPSRYQNFLSFIKQANVSPYVGLTVRSHPGKRTLEKDQSTNGFKFLQGALTPEAMAKFHAFVSPPSTILLDAVMAGIPSAVWTDAANLGDAANYDRLPKVCDFEDWLDIRGKPTSHEGLKWAVRNTAALNGLPAAWATILSLA